MIAALLIAGAAVAHAVWNIAMKRAGTSGTTFIAATLVVGGDAWAGITAATTNTTPKVASRPLPKQVGGAVAAGATAGAGIGAR